MSWVLASLLAAGMALVAVLPVYYWLRAVKIPRDISMVFAPAVTVILLSIIGALWQMAGWNYSGLTVIPVLGVLGVLGYLVNRRVNSGPQRSLGWQFWVVVAAGWLLAVLPWMLIAPPENPVQQWDPSFHMNGVWSIVGTGDGGWNSALAENYADGEPSSYPIAWHLFVALFATQQSVVFASNASTLALTLLWVVGAGVYTKTLFRVRAAWTIAPLLAGGMLSMPADALGAYSQWPNATAVALMPGLAAFAVWLGRKFVSSLLSSTWSPLMVAWAALGLAGVAGGLRSHPSLAFNLLFLLIPAVLAGLWTLWRTAIDRRNVAGIIGWPSLLVVGAAVVVWAYNTPEVQHMGDYPRGGQSWAVALGNFLTPSPPYVPSVSMSLAVITVAGLMILGFACYIMTLVRGNSLPVWPFWSFLLFAGLVLIAYGPDSSFREFLVAPWFLDARRIMEPQNLTMVPIAALGFAWVVGLVRNLVDVSATVIGAALAAFVLLVSGGAGFGARMSAAQGVYDPNNLGKPGMATAGELEMLRSLDEVLPADAVVLGDPQNGSVYAQVIGQRRALFPQLTLSGLPEAKQTLVDSFNDLHTDPTVCEAVRELGVTHFYEDQDGFYYQKLRSERTPGLYNVDTSTGFELVASGDTARVYRITACD